VERQFKETQNMQKRTLVIALTGLLICQQAETASAFTPSTSMIKQACVEMGKGFDPKLNSLKSKLNLQPDQTSLWKVFSDKVKATTQPVVTLCIERFGPDAPEPGWFAKTAERQKADQDRALFMNAMQGMDGGMKSAMSALRAGLSPEQLKTVATEMQH
jgi:LTXXQ motif family protein